MSKCAPHLSASYCLREGCRWPDEPLCPFVPEYQSGEQAVMYGFAWGSQLLAVTPSASYWLVPQDA